MLNDFVNKKVAVAAYSMRKKYAANIQETDQAKTNLAQNLANIKKLQQKLIIAEKTICDVSYKYEQYYKINTELNKKNFQLENCVKTLTQKIQDSEIKHLELQKNICDQQRLHTELKESEILLKCKEQRINQLIQLNKTLTDQIQENFLKHKMTLTQMKDTIGKINSPNDEIEELNMLPLQSKNTSSSFPITTSPLPFKQPSEIPAPPLKMTSSFYNSDRLNKLENNSLEIQKEADKWWELSSQLTQWQTNKKDFNNMKKIKQNYKQGRDIQVKLTQHLLERTNVDVETLLFQTFGNTKVREMTKSLKTILRKIDKAMVELEPKFRFCKRFNS